MRGTVLAIVGIGLPLGVMIAVWSWLNAAAPPPEGQRRQPPLASAEPPSQRRDEQQARDIESLAASHELPVAGADAQGAALFDAVASLAGRLEDAARRSPEHARTAAGLLLRQGRYEAAAVAFDRLLVRSPDDFVLLSGKGLALSYMGRFDDGLVLLEAVLRNHPDDPLAHFNHGVALMRAGEHDAAKAALQRVLELQPHNAKALFNLAVLAQAMGEQSEALGRWRKLTESKPQMEQLPAAMRLDAWSHRGELALRAREAVEAEACFMQIAEAEPRNAKAWCNVGIARAEQVRRGDAATALQIALHLQPNLVPALNQLAYIEAANFRDTGDVTYKRHVVELCRRSLQADPAQRNVDALQRAVRSFEPIAGGQRD